MKKFKFGGKFWAVLLLFAAFAGAAFASVCFLPNPSQCLDDGDVPPFADVVLPDLCPAGKSYSAERGRCIDDCDLSDELSNGVLVARWYSTTCPSDLIQKGHCADAYGDHYKCGCRSGYAFDGENCYRSCLSQGYTYLASQRPTSNGWQCDMPCSDPTGTYYRCDCRDGYSGPDCLATRSCNSLYDVYGSDQGDTWDCEMKTDADGETYYCCMACVVRGATRSCQGGLTDAQKTSGYICSSSCTTCIEGETRWQGCICDATHGYSLYGDCCYLSSLCPEQSARWEQPTSPSNTYDAIDLGCGDVKCYKCKDNYTFSRNACVENCSADYRFNHDKSSEVGWTCDPVCTDALGSHYRCECGAAYDEVADGRGDPYCSPKRDCDGDYSYFATLQGSDYECYDAQDANSATYYCCKACQTGGSSSCTTGQFTNSISAKYICSSSCVDCNGNTQYSSCICNGAGGYVSYNNGCCRPSSCASGVTETPLSASSTYDSASIGCGMTCYTCKERYYMNNRVCESCYDKYNSSTFNLSGNPISVDSEPTGCKTYLSATCGEHTYYYNIADITCGTGEHLDESCQCQQSCSYMFAEATINDVNLSGCRAEMSGQPANTCTQLRNWNSIYEQQYSVGAAYYSNKIDKTSPSCQRNGVTYYERLCSGNCTLNHFINHAYFLDSNSYKQFTSNGCRSNSYSIGDYTISGDLYGTCSGTCTYTSKSACESATGKTCFMYLGCYVRCEDHGYYSTQSSCEAENNICIQRSMNGSNCWAACSVGPDATTTRPTGCKTYSTRTCNGTTYYYNIADKTCNADEELNTSSCQCQPICNYTYTKATTSDVAGCNPVNEGTYCSGLAGVASIYAGTATPRTGITRYYYFNKISNSGNQCQKPDGTDYYESVCTGTPRTLALGTDSNRITCREFTVNGCRSDSYTTDNGFDIPGDIYGTCSDTCTYTTQNACQHATGKTCMQTSSNCYVSCESQGYYDTQSACESDTGLGCAPRSNRSLSSQNCWDTCGENGYYYTLDECTAAKNANSSCNSVLSRCCCVQTGSCYRLGVRSSECSQ